MNYCSAASGMPRCGQRANDSRKRGRSCWPPSDADLAHIRLRLSSAGSGRLRGRGRDDGRLDAIHTHLHNVNAALPHCCADLLLHGRRRLTPESGHHRCCVHNGAGRDGDGVRHHRPGSLEPADVRHVRGQAPLTFDPDADVPSTDLAPRRLGDAAGQGGLDLGKGREGGAVGHGQVHPALDAAGCPGVSPRARSGGGREQRRRCRGGLDGRGLRRAGGSGRGRRRGGRGRGGGGACGCGAREVPRRVGHHSRERVVGALRGSAGP
mmetsp:Transcript_92004/g.256319  ORF Transcript_92004/g.256319 Transcript_92004/m.256319 type:complete len:266 (+) Transcript_92004:433-1230(+)